MTSVALLFGGGGAEGPVNNAVISALGILWAASLLSVWIRRGPSFHRHSLGVLALGLGLVAIPLAQLVPLPPSIWHGLSGREAVRETLSLIGLADAWRPLSLNPEATLRSAMFLAFPIASFLYAATTSHSAKLGIMRTLVLCASISGLIGAGQLALGHPDWLSFYDGPSPGSASGIFANPNHQGLFMAVALVACGLFIREAKADADRRRPYPVAAALAWLGVIFFAVMALASGSRAAVLLVALAIPCALLLATAGSSFSRKAIIAVLVAIILIGVILAYPGTNTLGARESFRIAEDARHAYLPDILFTLRQYWPAGSGLGSFAGLFSIHENLDVAASGYLNHAHNDLLEWMIETGYLGGAWLIIASLSLTYFGFRKIREGGVDQAGVLCAIFIVLLVGMHSLVDYPLRSLAIASLFAFAAGSVMGPGGRERPAPDLKTRWVTLLVLAVALPFAVLILRMGVSAAAARQGNVTLALQVKSQDPRSLVDAARQALATGEAANAERFAIKAIEREPLSAAGLSALAASLDALRKKSRPVWEAAGALGWRDRQTQAWALHQAVVENDAASAVLRADALMRTGAMSPQLLTAVRLLSRNDRFASSLSARLALNPAWRTPYFTLAHDASPAEASGLLETFRQMVARGEHPTKADLRSPIAFFLASKDWPRVTSLEQLARGPQRKPGYHFDDGGFERSAEEYLKNSTPFDWQVLKGAHAAASIETAPPTRLVVDSDGEQTSLAAHRYLAMAPGRYILAFQAKADNADSFQVKMTCSSSSDETTTAVIPRSAEFQEQSLIFHVAPSCSVMRLMIEALPAGAPATVEFDEFRIKADQVGNQKRRQI